MVLVEIFKSVIYIGLLVFEVHLIGESVDGDELAVLRL
jgi:hypothetical protein